MSVGSPNFSFSAIAAFTQLLTCVELTSLPSIKTIVAHFIFAAGFQTLIDFAQSLTTPEPKQDALPLPSESKEQVHLKNTRDVAT